MKITKIDPDSPARPYERNSDKGLTIREEFAARAMQGMLDNSLMVGNGFYSKLDTEAIE